MGTPVVFEASGPQDLILGAALASRTEGGDRDTIDAAVHVTMQEPAQLKTYQIARFTPFDPVSKRTEAEVKHDNATFKVSKGAPQVILDLVHPDADARKKAEGQVNDLAAKGFRTLGVARTDAQGKWKFLGLLPMSDPPRDDSASTIATARRMGLQVRMQTGDNIAIAREISRELKLGPKIAIASELFAVGRPEESDKIEAADGFAQVFPEHKFHIVKALQARGRIVGMTGDGVNNAPALKQADCGIAVSGATDAARAAADLVLTAPGLSVITTAIEEARKIFERMNSYAIYRISRKPFAYLSVYDSLDYCLQFLSCNGCDDRSHRDPRRLSNHDDCLRQCTYCGAPRSLGDASGTGSRLRPRPPRSYFLIRTILGGRKIPLPFPSYDSDGDLPEASRRGPPDHLYHAQRWGGLGKALAKLAFGRDY